MSLTRIVHSNSKRPAGPGRKAAALALAFLPLAGCASLTYYSQSVTGHLRIMAGREPIDEVLASPETDPAVRAKLEVIQGARSFASEWLGLPRNKSYRYFTRLDRPYAVWNVVATPRFSLEPKRWCFPIAGCVTYRGYFDRADAGNKARELAAEGMDTAVLGATAYSTLGWFSDPVLTPMLEYPDPELAGLIFHELAHQRLYVSGDTAFNEAFASVVEEVGVERWIRARGEPGAARGWRMRRQYREAVTAAMLDAREGLEALYERADAMDEATLARRKTAILGILRQRHAAVRRAWRDLVDPGRLPDELNNAHLALVGAYSGGKPAFRRLLVCLDGDLAAFYRAAERIGEWPADRRGAWLEGSKAAPACAAGA